MSRNTMYAIIALLLVVILGAAGGYWAVKKIRAKQNQEFRYEGKLTVVKEGVDPETFKMAVLTGDTLDETIEKHNLVAQWKLADAEAAKAKIKEKFIVKVSGLEVTLSYQDKDQALAKDILGTLMDSFYKRQKAMRGGAPVSQ
ncbi:hypothetical protein NT6N_11680 [Oceaniferula spumae]|uniref:Uncharacterized protein n=1 Tax=Oceaniferula spumae TaxID=2979115 RepID=A0AAT9FJD3_9BACT